jgi:hypothetical protein
MACISKNLLTEWTGNGVRVTPADYFSRYVPRPGDKIHSNSGSTEASAGCPTDPIRLQSFLTTPERSFIFADEAR